MINFSGIEKEMQGTLMKTHDFYYELPEELIAQHPVATRSDSRLLLLDKKTGEYSDRHFRDLPEFLNPGDLLVINNTRVIPARLMGVRSDTGTVVEIFLLKSVVRLWLAPERKSVRAEGSPSPEQVLKQNARMCWNQATG